MLYVMENYWKAIAADYERAQTTLSYSLDAYCRALAQDARALISR